jgi:hypothetical protein
MITANNYQDVQIIQDADFENIITFDAEYDTSLYSYQAKIAKDRVGTVFGWDGGTTPSVGFTIVKTSATVLTLSLTADNTKNFDDDFEGVWDLLSKKTSDSTYTRELEGDVVVSPSVTAKF